MDTGDKVQIIGGQHKTLIGKTALVLSVSGQQVTITQIDGLPSGSTRMLPTKNLQLVEVGGGLLRIGY